MLLMNFLNRLTYTHLLFNEPENTVSYITLKITPLFVVVHLDFNAYTCIHLNNQLK